VTGLPSVVYVLPDKMGGLLNIVAHLLAYRRPDGMEHDAVLVHNPLSADTRFGGRLAADRQISFVHRLPTENLHAVLRRLARAIPRGPGVLVANDWLELAMLCRHDPGRTVVQILHGDHDYYYDLAANHEAVIDVFVAYGATMYETLRRRLPHRLDSILHLPYGIPLPARGRAPAPGPLRLLFAGRLEHGQKGVFDLPEIDRRLAALGVAVTWTVVGEGPDGAALRARWTGPSPVRWLGARPNAFVIALLAAHDVFVLPTRSEGFPVALLEAMAAGLVPVVSDIASGVPEVVTSGRTGCLPAVGDAAGFAAAIAGLARDRERLERMSAAARREVSERFDVRLRVAAYQDLYARCRELRRPRPRTIELHYGSRLDQPWIPNPLVRAVRTPRRWLRRRELLR
jgi:glycosyltransferase involved in cell wall biosynthesis